MALPRLPQRSFERDMPPPEMGDDALPGSRAPQARAPAPQASAADEVEITCKLGKMLFPREIEALKDNPFRIQVIRIGKVESALTTSFPVTAQLGDTVLARGKWTKWKNKDRFEASVVTLAISRDLKGVLAWMKNLEGIGVATGRKLAKRFGEDLADVLDDTDKLIEAGIPRHKAELISETARERGAEVRCVQRLRGLNIGDKAIAQCMDRYGLGIERTIDTKPWELADVIPGIGFKTADEIGLRAGHPPDSPMRIVSAIRDALKDAINQNGHCGLPLDVLVKEASFKTRQPAAMVSAHLDDALDGTHHSFDPSTGLASWTRMHRDEQDLADHVLALLEHSTPESRAVEAALARAEDEVREESSRKGGRPFSLDPAQRRAAKAALSNKVCIITGGPGTGKSTILKVILKALKILGRTVVCAAPTGRAAKRIQETTGKEASTCHKLLQYEGESFKVGAANQFPQDWFVIDEFSMVDTRLAHSFITAIKLGAGLTIVGDVDQLPPVGPGQVLRDLIASGLIPVARLDTVHRQAEGSGIAIAAHRINRGEHPQGGDRNVKMDGYHPKQVPAGEDISAAVVRLITKQGKYNPLLDIQVLATMKRGPGGVDELNQTIKAALNPANADDGRSVFFEPRAFTVGDRVMQNRNSYEKNVSNGEVGTVLSVGQRERKNGKSEPCITVDFGAVTATYGRSDISDIDLAYAATVHKSQGCEFKVVIFACPDEHRRHVYRNLVYTALTRAKEWYCFIGSDYTLTQAISVTDANRRHTGLCKRLMQARPFQGVRTLDDPEPTQDSAPEPDASPSFR